MPDTASRPQLLQSPNKMRIINTHRQIILDGLIGWWPFDEGSGSTAGDASGNGLDGTLISMTEGDWVTGRWGTGYALDFVTDDRVKVTYDSSMYSTTMSVVLWIDSDTTNYTANAYIVSQYDYVTSKRTWALIVRAVDDEYSITTSTDGSATAGGHTTQSVETGWHHLAITTDDTGDTWKFYYDGSLEGTYSGTDGYGDNGSFLTIGGLDKSGNTIDGRLDDVRIYSRVLTSAEIAAIAAGLS